MSAKPFRFQLDGKTLGEFFSDRSTVSIIQGPIESGTSTAALMKLWKLSEEQVPDEYGVRRSRWAIIRNTYDELKRTTLKTWRYWFEEKALGTYGEVKMTNPPDHHIRRHMRDGTTVDAEFIFLALDQEEDVRKLLSSELTGAFFNEVQFSEKVIFNTVKSRTGRYPPVLDGGATWSGVIADLNAPPEGHWIPYMRGDLPIPEDWDDETRAAFVKPDGWKFFIQPPGLLEVIKDGKVVGYEPNPAAENTKWQRIPYMEKIKGNDKDWIDTYIMNRVGLYRSGRAVFPSFRPEIHVSKGSLDYVPEFPLVVGLDFARNPAMVAGQMIRGQMHVLDEFGVENASAVTYAPLFKQRLMRKFPVAFKNGIQFWGDPTGDSKGQGTDRTPYQIFQANGMNVIAAPGNNSMSVRIAAVQSLLNNMVDGSPALLVDLNCRMIKVGLGGGYHYAKVKGTSRHHDEPHKDRYADFCDAFQYLCLGAGLGFSALSAGGAKPAPVRVPRKTFSLRRRG